MAIKTNLFAALLLAAASLPIVSLSQTLYEGTERILTTDQENDLLAVVTDYEVFDLPINLLKNELNAAGGAPVDINLKIGTEYDWILTIEENEIRASNYLLAEQTDNGTILHQRSDEVNTYKGYIDGDTTQWLRLFISNDKVSGILNSQGKTYVVEPLNEIIPTTPDTNFNWTLVIGEKLDWQQFSQAPSSWCAFTSNFDPSSGGTPVGERHFQVRFLELATEVDYQFYLAKSDPSSPTPVTDVEDAVLRLINIVDGLYVSAFNLEIQLVYQNVWATENDPYGCCSIQNMWSECKQYWENNKDCVHKDAVAMISGQGLLNDGYVASQGERAICGFPQPNFCPGDDTYYSISKAISPEAGSAGDAVTARIIAHELGHNFGLQHTNDLGIMDEGTGSFDPETVEFGDSSLGQMHNILEGTEVRCIGDQILLVQNDICMAEPAPINYDFNILLNPNQVILGDNPICGDEFTLSFFSTFYFYEIEWELGPGLELVGGNLNSQSIDLKSTQSSHITFISVSFDYNCEGLVTFTREFSIGTPAPDDADLVQVGETGFYNVKLDEPVLGATHYDVTWTHTNPYGFTYSSLPQPYYVAPSHDPIAGYGSGSAEDPDLALESGSTLHLEVAAVNACGTSDFLIVDWTLNNAGGNGSNNLIANKGKGSNGHSVLSLEAEVTKTTERLTFEELIKEKENLRLSEKMETFDVYPNPSNGNFHILIPLSEHIKYIRCYDTTGRLQHEQEIPGSVWKVEINSKKWQDGMYIIELENNGKKEIQKILIQ